MDVSLRGGGAAGAGPFFLGKITHPDGSQTIYTYENTNNINAPFRLAGLTRRSADGLLDYSSLIFQYNSATDTLLTRIYSTTRGATNDMVLTYNAMRQLTSIKDMIGMTTTFTYLTGSDFIMSMTTPYGRTSFSSSGSGAPIWVEATDPLGGRERVEVRVDAGLGAAFDPLSPANIVVRNASLNTRNTYHWHKKAMLEIGEDPTMTEDEKDARAHVTHWLLNPETNQMGPIPHSTKAPLEARIWYHYPGQTSSNGSYYGSSSQAIKIARGGRRGLRGGRRGLENILAGKPKESGEYSWAAKVSGESISLFARRRSGDSEPAEKAMWISSLSAPRPRSHKLRWFPERR